MPKSELLNYLIFFSLFSITSPSGIFNHVVIYLIKLNHQIHKRLYLKIVNLTKGQLLWTRLLPIHQHRVLMDPLQIQRGIIKSQLIQFASSNSLEYGAALEAHCRTRPLTHHMICWPPPLLQPSRGWGWIYSLGLNILARMFELIHHTYTCNWLYT